MQETNQAIESEVITEQPIESQQSEETVSDEVVSDVEQELNNDTEQEGVEEEREVSEELESGEELEHEEKFPKKAERALERRNKKINKLRAENAELQRAIQEYQATPPQPEDLTAQGLQEPKEDDFGDYADYLKAVGKYEADKEYATKQVEATQQQYQQQQQQWVQERAQYVDQRAAEAVKNIPELNGLYQENQDIIEGYSNETKIAFLEADKPELAFYALAKEGKLEQLDTMSPSRIAREIALAEIKGEEMSKARPVSKAPAPIKPAKGTGTSRKTLDDMSPSELIAHIKKQK